MIDLDGLKQVNDSLDTSAATKLLRAVGEGLARLGRSYSRIPAGRR